MIYEIRVIFDLLTNYSTLIDIFWYQGAEAGQNARCAFFTEISLFFVIDCDHLPMVLHLRSNQMAIAG